MADNASGKVANQTEIPVSSLPKKESSGGLSVIGGKLPFIVVGAFVAVVVLVAIFLFAGDKSTKKQDPLYVGAQAAISRGDYDQAEKLLRQALAVNKDDPQGLSMMITTISLKGNQTGQEANTLADAKPYIDEATSSNSDDINVVLAVGYAYETAGDYQKALDYYTQATKIDPKSSNAWFHLGHTLEFLNRTQDAQKAYDTAFSLDPNNPLVLIVRGNMFLSQGKVEDSVNSFKKAAEQPNISAQSKSEALAAASVATISQDFRQMSQALTLSKQAVDADPTFSPALGAYGYNLILTGNAKEGVDYLNRAIKANPRITRNYYNLALAYRAGKNYAAAINYLKLAIAGVANDNTILSNEDKMFTKGSLTYELAKTYSASGLKIDTYSLINDALSLRPSLKTQVIADYKNGLFKELATNQNFLTLVGP